MDANEPCSPRPDAFCHVVEETADGTIRRYVVHTGAPRVVVELQSDPNDPAGQRRDVIRRIRVPNAWDGNYRACARVIDAALRVAKANPDPSPPSPRSQRRA